jgi:uncharacterized protein
MLRLAVTERDEETAATRGNAHKASIARRGESLVETVEVNDETRLRASSYTIYVDLPDDPDHVLLVHGSSGTYDRVRSEVANYVRSRDQRPPKPLFGSWSIERVTAPVVAPGPDVIDDLKKRGHLTLATRDEERAKFIDLVERLHRRETRKMPAYVVMPTYDCNLRCDYCFQDHMRTDQRFGHLLRFIAPSIIDRLVHAMPGIEQRHGFSPGAPVDRQVLFYGGEPLLARSRSIVEYAMNAVRAIGGVSFSAVTNATELDAYEDLLGPGGIAALQITIDGPKRLHDARRIYADQSGSFDCIAQNVDMALGRGVHVDVRVNVDRANVHALGELAASFVDRGWTKRPGFSAYVHPVQAPSDKANRKNLFNSDELNEAVRAMRARDPKMATIDVLDDSLQRQLGEMLDGDRLPMLRATFCGAHTTMYIVDPFGDIYSCWEKTGDKNIRIGWLSDAGEAEFVADRLAAWRSRNVASNATCAQCRYSMYCGGGCAVYAEDVHGTMHGNYCDAFGRRFRKTVARAYADRAARLKRPDQPIEVMRAL